MTSLFAIFNLGTPEIIVLLVLGVLLFGRRLPEVGRYLGKGIVEFKKGVKGLEDEVDMTGASAPHSAPAVANDQIRAPQRVAATAPKFEDAPAPAANTNVTAPPRI
jgi:sec-independent protein translocase protein TatA